MAENGDPPLLPREALWRGLGDFLARVYDQTYMHKYNRRCYQKNLCTCTYRMYVIFIDFIILSIFHLHNTLSLYPREAPPRTKGEPPLSSDRGLWRQLRLRFAGGLGQRGLGGRALASVRLGGWGIWVLVSCKIRPTREGGWIGCLGCERRISLL